MAIGFGLQEISGGLGRSREVREINMAAVDHSFERLCHEGKSWNERWLLREYFSVSGRSLCLAFKIRRPYSCSILEEMPQELPPLNLLKNPLTNCLLETNLFVNKRTSLNDSLSTNLKKSLKHFGKFSFSAKQCGQLFNE